MMEGRFDTTNSSLQLVGKLQFLPQFISDFQMDSNWTFQEYEQKNDSMIIEVEHTNSNHNYFGR